MPQRLAWRALGAAVAVSLCMALRVSASQASQALQAGGAMRLPHHNALRSSVYEDAQVAMSADGFSWWDWLKRVFHVGAAAADDDDEPTPAYNETMAVYLARVTSVAYCGAKHIRDWSCSPCALVDPLDDIHVLEDMKDNFQGLVGYNAQRDEVLVAFRGSMDIKNWIDNLTFVKRRPYARFPAVKVHQGFYWVYESVAQQVVPAVRGLLQAHPTAAVVVTGHSLGGAVAALCSFDLALLQEIRVRAVYTFGEPRVGNANFSALLNEGIPEVYRVTHFRDVVPHLPPSWIGFQHSAQEVFYDEYASSFRVCNATNGEDPLCSNACSPFGCTSVVDHLTYVNVTMSHLIC